MLNIKKLFYRQQGFTLVEVLVSLAILSILIIGFLPIITGSFQQIVAAGDRTQSLFKAQQTIEVRIVDEIVFKGAEIPIVMEDGRSFSIKGGMVEADQLQTFLPWIPTISIEPNIVDEGYSPNDVTIMLTGENTNFKSESSIITLTNSKGYSYSPSLTVVNNHTASFNLLRGSDRLINAGSEYMITITTGNEVVRAKLKVRLPRLVTIVGDATLEVSNDILFRENALTSVGKIERVLWEGNRFFAIGKHNSSNEGMIYVLEENSGWDKKNTDVSNSLKGLAYDGKRFVAVGDQATIITSTDGNSWSKIEGDKLPLEVSSRNLNAVTWGTVLMDNGTSTEYFVAIGEKHLDLSPEVVTSPKHDFGIILVSEDGLAWKKVEYFPEMIEEDISVEEGNYKTLNDITYSNGKFLAVGEQGSILLIEKVGEDWKISIPESNPAENTSDLNAIIFSQEIDKLITVGENGKIYTSTDSTGNVWTIPSVSGTNTQNQLMDISYGGMENEEKFIAVGDRVIATSYDGNHWSFVSIGTSGNIRSSIASRR